jgi:hypothetical protein
VSKHFNYTEEYVLSHTPSWLNRKVKQAQNEMFDDHNAKVLEGFQSALLLLDAVFNKGKEFNKILPPSIEAAMEDSRKKAEIESRFVTGQWWKKSNEVH